MITLLTALYQEAEPFIQHFQLKKSNTFKPFQLFTGAEIQLLITNPGSISAAVALTQLLCSCPFTSNDIFINIGICGCDSLRYPAGTIFLCNKLVDSATQMTCYPDILYKHPFLEASLITVPIPQKMSSLQTENLLKPAPSSNTFSLYDMESFALYQAGSTYLKQHQMLFIKIISDHLTPDTIKKENISCIFSSALSPLFSFLSNLFHRPALEKEMITKEDKELLCLIAETFHFSSTMTEQLKQLFLYGKSLQLPIYSHFLDFFQSFCNQEAIQKEQLHFTKKEGKQYLEQLKQFITSHVSSHLCGNKSTFSS